MEKVRVICQGRATSVNTPSGKGVNIKPSDLGDDD